MSFRQTGSARVPQRGWSVEAVMISFYYHNVDTNFLRNSISLLDSFNVFHYIRYRVSNNPYLRSLRKLIYCA